MRKIHITQGELATGASEDVVISTILGSCVSICLHDPVAGVGGMNHMLLADLRVGASAGTLGAAEIERLVNELRHLGADAGRLRAKIFGGASMLDGMTDIGERNARFALAWLKREGIGVDARSVGGTQARQLMFIPATGVARQRFVSERPTEAVVGLSALNGVEMF